MENELSKALAESFSMKGGEGPSSYAQNSSIQREKIEAAKMFLQDAIAKKLDPNALSANQICIADLGCSTGTNAFIAVQYIIEAVESQYHSQGLAVPEFQVFFNDLVLNDFNTLFRNLPPERTYFAAGIPGSFYGRLFPNKTLHVVHSSSTLGWISEIPREITNRNSVAYNKGRIHVGDAPKEVVDAYATQYQLDMETFLNARAQELVAGGLMLLQIPCEADAMLDSEISRTKFFELLGSCLADMAKEGIFGEEDLDSFNLPLYFPPLKNLEEILEGNGDFSVEGKEIYPEISLIAPNNVKMGASHCRATLEVLIEKHFGDGIVDDLFQRYVRKVMEFAEVMKVQKFKSLVLFVLLNRKP
ncbi:hypothetical protein L6164_026789 [Bauhinia variegata]|uniref:Uncharacterized protein n=1 Tax=Bauhinia variegata TaxID=167791 RepID=A0ACB9LRA8_BAUVA|nr:hypothetical protein L6164_026789 [Bauhinia variegata]